MPLAVDLADLIAYTDWQRGKWHVFLRQHEDALQSSAGPNGDGRFTTIGDLGKHIFSAEKRYVDRLSNRPLTDPASIPNADVEALFAFGRQSRQDLREFIDSFPATEWDVAQEHTILNHKLHLTPRKIVVHVVVARNSSLGADRHSAALEQNSDRVSRFHSKSCTRRSTCVTDALRNVVLAGEKHQELLLIKVI